MDILKLCILIIGALLILLIGYLLKKKYKQKYVYCLNLIDIINFIKIEIGFNKTNLKEIISKVDTKYLCDEIKNFINYYQLNNKAIFNLLNENENKIINEYFDIVGQTDYQNALMLTEKILIELKQINEKYKLDYKNNGNLVFKLCVCLSLVYMIIFI